jgi:hypothetical protein
MRAQRPGCTLCGVVRVSTVAEVVEEQASSLITRENVSRKAVISCNVAAGHNLGYLIAEIRRRVDPLIAARSGMYVEYGGQFEAQEEASQRILWASVGVLVLTFLLLYAAFGSARPVLLVLLNLPLALVGGIVALLLADSPSFWRNVAGLFGGAGYVAPVVSTSPPAVFSSACFAAVSAALRSSSRFFAAWIVFSRVFRLLSSFGSSSPRKSGPNVLSSTSS